MDDLPKIIDQLKELALDAGMSSNLTERELIINTDIVVTLRTTALLLETLIERVTLHEK